jgi:hypothetical protein
MNFVQQHIIMVLISSFLICVIMAFSFLQNSSAVSDVAAKMGRLARTAPMLPLSGGQYYNLSVGVIAFFFKLMLLRLKMPPNFLPPA